MNALQTTYVILNSPNLLDANLKYCLVDVNKLPHKIDGSLAKPNSNEDFVDFLTILENYDVLEKYTSLGISIQASVVCVVDIDRCFKIPFDKTSCDERAKYALELFKDTYIEFSFSGTGLRIILYMDEDKSIKNNYYIKNSLQHIECYFPWENARYVTLTGQTIYNNKIVNMTKEMKTFLDKYMIRETKTVESYKIQSNNLTLTDILNMIHKTYLKDIHFQDLWFAKAPGSGKNESELDYELLAYLYENFTQNKEMLRQAFEESPYYKSKDAKHIKKWEYEENRYYNSIYNRIYTTHQGGK